MLPSDPPRRRRSRETSRVKSAKRLETHQKSGTTTIEASASSHCSQKSAPTKKTSLSDGSHAAGELADHEGLDRGDVGGQPGQHVTQPAPVVV